MNNRKHNKMRQVALSLMSGGTGGLLLTMGGLSLCSASKASAQTCFAYSDGSYEPKPGETRYAKAPIQCVQQGDLTAPCAWNADCALDGNPSDCCTLVPSTTPQTILKMHELWHQCFGSTADHGSPPGRGQRWYAFHRQFEIDFNRWRNARSIFAIESLPWCKNMPLPIGHRDASNEKHPKTGDFLSVKVSDPGSPSLNSNPNSFLVGRHIRGCGAGIPRPNGKPCPSCEAFPPCLFYGGAGPLGCDFAGDSTRCAGRTKLEQFPTVDEVAKVLDSYYHGSMHGAVGHADTGNYINDLGGADCSPRDPMFWRLHKALDDVVRAWQDHKAVDVMIVIDRSGSMKDPASGGGGATKLEAALAATRMFADLLPRGRTDGVKNRIGIVSYESSARIDLPLTNADASLLASGGPFLSALASIRATGPGGCTSIGGGIEKALAQLCPVFFLADDCRGFSIEGDNDRKAILLLTDGLENRSPCLHSVQPTATPTCVSTCGGGALDLKRLDFTQLVAVGFGPEGSVNGDLLTLVAERQGGVYLLNRNAKPGDDLKNFFAKAFGALTEEFILKDPQGFLPANTAVSEPIEYTSCGDERITFASGWQAPVIPGELRLIVTSPHGDLVRKTDPTLQASTTELYDYARIPLPYRGESSGTWRAHLIRPHQVYVNGFTPDSFANIDEGVAIVRRQIQRLCPDGCANVLSFEIGRVGVDSAYELALAAEQSSGLLGSITQIADVNDLANLLRDPWDLIVYAYMGENRPQPHDAALSDVLCQQQRAILTDSRPSNCGLCQGGSNAGENCVSNADCPGAACELLVCNPLVECLGVERDGTANWESMNGDRRLVDGSIEFSNPGHSVATYGLVAPAGRGDTQATANSGATGAVVALARAGDDQYWFVNVLGRGLSKLDPHLTQSVRKTRDGLLATVRMLPSYWRDGGYDRVHAWVEVEYPLVGIGSLFCEFGLGNEREVAGELLDQRAAALASMKIPTATTIFPLFDDGTHGDVHANNAYWTTDLPGIGIVDGMYTFRFMLDFTVGDCMTRRELVQSVFVDLVADPTASLIDIGPTVLLPDGRGLTVVRIEPLDTTGNCWGPGRSDVAVCGPAGECDVDSDGGMEDNGDGSYTVRVITAQGVASVRIFAFGASFDVLLPCHVCPALGSLTIDPTRVREHSSAVGLVELNGPTPFGDAGGARVYLDSSHPLAASVPDSVVVPQGTARASFPVTVNHVLASELADAVEPLDVTLSASYGGQVARATLTVVPEASIHDGDCDLNNTVDLLDFGGWPTCASGPVHSLLDSTCACYDLDTDGDSDLADFADFQNAFAEGRND